MKSALSMLIKEPLLHFVLLGSLLFIVSAYWNPPPEGPESVSISAQKIAHLKTIFKRKWKREPTAAELEKIVDDHVVEELYYREALALQMDQDDTVIRRRLRQKMEFLMLDLSQSMKPTDEQLQAYLDEHAARFALPASYSFEQVYLNPDKHDDVEEAIARVRASVAAGEAPTGDVGMLPKTLDDTPGMRVTSFFGESFTAQLAELALEQWQGPIRSAYGWHWVYLRQYRPSSHPPLDSVYGDVLREWQYDMRRRASAELQQKLLQKYRVEIDWPDSEAPADNASISAIQ